MKQPMSHKTKTIRKMKGKEWKEYIRQFLPGQDATYKGKPLQNFDGWEITEVEQWLKGREKRYTDAKIKKEDDTFLHAEIVHGKQELAARRAKYDI